MKRAVGQAKIHKVFADNLRQHCTRFDSIAELCRACDINRQQFNRYLSGQNLPNPRTLKKLSDVLNVSEASLFQTEPAMTAAPIRSSLQTLDFNIPAHALSPAGHRALQNNLTRIAEKQQVSDFSTGYYFCYMPIPNQPGFVLRTLIKVINAGGIARFARRTSYSRIGAPKSQFAIGRHVGILIADLHATLFLGFNAIYPHEVSVLKALRRIADHQTPTPGLALLRAPEHEFACKICFEWLGTGFSTAKAAIKRLGIVALADDSISPVVRTLISGPNASDPAGHAVLVAQLDSISGLL